MYSIIDTLLETIRTTEGEKHCAAASLLCAFVSHTRADLTPHVPQLIRGLILLFADQDHDVLLMAWEALTALGKSLDPERQIAHVSDVRQAVRYATAELKPDELLPGFCLPKVHIIRLFTDCRKKKYEKKHQLGRTTLNMFSSQQNCLP